MATRAARGRLPLRRRGRIGNGCRRSRGRRGMRRRRGCRPNRALARSGLGGLAARPPAQFLTHSTVSSAANATNQNGGIAEPRDGEGVGAGGRRAGRLHSSSGRLTAKPARLQWPSKAWNVAWRVYVRGSEATWFNLIGPHPRQRALLLHPRQRALRLPVPIDTRRIRRNLFFQFSNVLRSNSPISFIIVQRPPRILSTFKIMRVRCCNGRTVRKCWE
jgi:hypothetical protein